MSCEHVDYVSKILIKFIRGFPTHPHKDFEIFSIILDGELTHRDSMGNVETLKRGHVQFTT